MLSVAMVVKNEIATLAETIQSVREYADEIIIGVDKESDDGTRELAKKLADHVFTTYLTDELRRKGPRPRKNSKNKEWGFSRARNQAFGKCKKTNWRLTLDGHETVINPEKMASTIEAAKAAGCDGIEVYLLFEPDESGIAKTMYRQGRLFAPSVRYNGPLHNVPVVKKVYTSDDFKIEHHKKQQDPSSKVQRDVQRSDSTINGFIKEIEKNPNNSRPWFYLGNAYKENGRWSEAIETYKRYLEISVWKEERWHARTNLGTCYSRIDDNINAREQYVLALEEFPPMAEAYYYLAELAYAQERFREAQVWLEFSIDMPIPNCKLFVNPKIYLVDRYDKLSMVYNHLGRYEDAIIQAKKALKSINGPSARIEKNIECWERALGRNNE